MKPYPKKKDLWTKVTVWYSSVKSSGGKWLEWHQYCRLGPAKLKIHPSGLMGCWTSWWMCAEGKISLVNSSLYTVMSETACYGSPGSEPARRCARLEVPSWNAIKQIGSRLSCSIPRKASGFSLMTLLIIRNRGEWMEIEGRSCRKADEMATNSASYEKQDVADFPHFSTFICLKQHLSRQVKAQNVVFLKKRCFCSSGFLMGTKSKGSWFR